MAATRSKVATAPAQAKKAQPSRKGKAAWRKNIDTQDLDEHLESQRVAERLGATLVDPSTAKDAELFQVDVAGDQELAGRLRKKKPMRSLQVLENTSAVPSLIRKGKGAANAASMSSRKGTGKMSKTEQDRLRRIAKRAVHGPFGAIEDESERKGLQALESIKGAVMKMPEEDPWQQRGTSQPSVSLPDGEASSVSMPSASSSTSKSTLPRLSAIPQTGQSYNPSLSSHNALLQRAYEVEKLRADKDQEEREFKKRWVEAGKHAREFEGNEAEESAAADADAGNGKRRKRFFAGMLIGSGDEAGSGEDEAADSDSADERSDIGEEEARAQQAGGTNRKALLPGQRKTKQQRVKEARVATAARTALQKRLLKEEASLMARLPSLSKAMQKRARERAQKLAERRAQEEEKMQQEGLAGKRFGKHRVPEDVARRGGLEVQLGEDLSESLRAVKTHQGLNLFRETWDSLTARGLTEPTKPVEKKGREGRRKFKEYETHAYKRFV
ncbi:unnamed protein product [Parajaminaea phylloscopi]